MKLREIVGVVFCWVLSGVLCYAQDDSAPILDRFNIDGYFQGQFQYGGKDAELKVGAENNTDDSFNRIGFRRGGIRVSYDDGIARGMMQINASEKGLGIFDLYLGVRDIWTRQNELKFGIYAIPFGYENTYSTVGLESPERSITTQYLFPTERDLGGTLTLRTKPGSPLHFLTLDVSLLAGNGINQETDNRRNLVGRLSAQKGNWGAGLSYYYGHVYNPTRVEFISGDDGFTETALQEAGTFMKREYFGLNARIKLPSSLGHTELRGETIFGTQPGTATSSKSQTYSKQPGNYYEYALYKRPFLGYFFYLIQQVKETPLAVVVKYESYDPNTDIKGKNIRSDNNTSVADLRTDRLGFGAYYDFSNRLRLQAFYDLIFDEKNSADDRKDNVFTLRLQYHF